MLRLLISIVLAAVITLSLFFLMQALIASGDKTLSDPPVGKVLDFVRVPKEENVEQKDNKPKQANNPLHGITLKTILEELVAKYGWEYMDEKVRINCFAVNPSINSSLKFLRKTPWAREKVEKLYLRSKK